MARFAPEESDDYDGEDDSGWRKVETAGNALEAAADFARRKHADADYPDTMAVQVKDTRDGEILTYDVTATQVMEFDARRRT
jgi:hypothetical protein